jgi:hypothetical protein
MTLVTCPECGRSISDAAPACVGCGRPTTVQTATADRPPLAPTYSPYAGANATGVPLPFFEVGLGKFVAMSVVTLGLYDLYWAYQQWTRIKARTGESLSPGGRAFFAHLWGFSLFERVRSDASAEGINAGWSSGALGTVYLIMGALWRLPDPWWVVSMLSFLPLIPVVQTISALHDKREPNRDRNSSFSGANVGGLVIGGGVLFLVLIGIAASP